MTDRALPLPPSQLTGPDVRKISRIDIGLKRRYAAERRFRAYGMAAISFGLIFLFLLLWSVVSKGHTAFQQIIQHVSFVFDFRPVWPVTSD